ncbi:pathogenicity-like protein [Stenotrophomonas sp. YAU14D1_LEIMI4_1]|uniref:pathogenicity-like protein n=1 Tax=Stenotrophomonas sp. YAU14D1_LEIMI4_1 TaxID=2072407 RepID=UPI000D53DF4C|nr:pathogenicity-like protein [Stenotrophomonas sp. YAU14D1_LEIMI4_1]AWH24654.1 pathogenicity-like protein [Stenotrophomonas sp. YAU14D1_LEIMI4_1]
MRQIFSSQRVETVEGVAELLRSHGIEVKVTNGRSYKTRRRGQFSYTDLGNAQAYPAVWIVRADDQPRARDILREARLLDTTRRDHPTAEFAFRDAPQEGGSGRGWAWRIRIGLLVVIAAVALVIGLRHRGAPAPATPAPAPAPQAQPQPAPQAAPEEEEVRVRIQPSS